MWTVNMWQNQNLNYIPWNNWFRKQNIFYVNKFNLKDDKETNVK